MPTWFDRLNVLMACMVSVLLLGCMDPVTMANMARYNEIQEEQEPKSPSKPVLGGMIVLMEPCEFKSVLPALFLMDL